MPTERAQVVRGPMVRSYKPCVRLGFAIARIVDCRRQSAITTGPIVKRDEVEVIVKCALGLLLNDAKYLIDGGMPWYEH